MDRFRKKYTTLDDIQKQHIKQIKEEAETLLALMDFSVPETEKSDRGRCMQIARTKLEECVMWAVKSITTKKDDSAWIK